LKPAQGFLACRGLAWVQGIQPRKKGQYSAPRRPLARRKIGHRQPDGAHGVTRPTGHLRFWRGGGRQRRGWRGVAAVIGRENAQQKFAAHAGVGGVVGRPFQISDSSLSFSISAKSGCAEIYCHCGPPAKATKLSHALDNACPTENYSLRIFVLSRQPACSVLARRHEAKPRLRRVRLHQFVVVLENHAGAVARLQRHLRHVFAL